MPDCEEGGIESAAVQKRSKSRNMKREGFIVVAALVLWLGRYLWARTNEWLWADM